MAVNRNSSRCRPSVDGSTSESSPPRSHHVVDIAEGLRPLPTGRAPRVLVTVLDEGMPIGSVEFVVSGESVPVDDQVVEIARALGDQIVRRRLERRVLALSSPLPDVSLAVVVCTRDRPDDLRRCLDSIMASACSPDEIVVVDNASADHRTRDVVESYHGRVRYVREPQPGLDRARNRGLAMIASDLVLFTDDDVEVASDWVERLANCFDDPAVGAACGLVLPARLDNDARDRFERYAGFGRGFQRRVIDPASTSPYAAGAHGAGASMAFRAATLRAVGGFPEELDAGMPTASGGDTYALGEMVRAGHRIVYEPAALAFHHHRSTEAELRRALRGYGTGLGAMLASAARRHRDPGVLTVGVPVVTRYVTGKLARTLRGRPGSTPPTLVAAEIRGLLDAPRGFRNAVRLAGDRQPVELHRAQPVDASRTAVPSRTLGSQSLGVSVVIPSRGRRDRLVALLRALDDQEYPDELIEYIVVIDGDIDGSASAVRRLALRRRLRVLVLEAPSSDPHHGNGAGHARNVGAGSATEEVLLFLDDDVLPRDRHLIAAHLDRHRQSAVDATGIGRVADIAVVGPCVPTAPPDGHRPTAHEIAVRLWWSDHAQRLVTGQHLEYADFGTGNVSIRRDVFERLGGFADLPRREDWEFGRRLIVRGGTIVGAADAVVLHDADYDVRCALEDRFREGRGDAAIARHDPALVHWSPLAEWSTARRSWQGLMDAMLRAADGALPIARGAAVAAAALDRLGLRHRHGQLKRVANTAAYWAGVGAELGGERGWHELRRQAREVRQSSVLRLEEVASWTPPSPGTVDEVVVTFGHRPVLVAPVSWGGLPWDRRRFLAQVLGKIPPLVDVPELAYGDPRTASVAVEGTS